MMKALIAVLTLAAMPAFADPVSSTSTSTVNGTGVQFNAMANQTLGNKTVTVTIGNGMAPTLTQTPGGVGPGANAGTLSATLAIGATLGNGTGSAGSTAGSTAGPGLSKF